MSRLLGSITLLVYRLRLNHVLRLVPHGLRDALILRLTRVDGAFKTKLSAATHPYILMGLVSSDVSFGYAARATQAHLKLQGISPALIDVSAYYAASSGSQIEIINPDGFDLEGPASLVVHVNPNRAQFMLSLLPKALREGKYLIAYCVWELEIVPESWLEVLQNFNEVWVPSQFVKQALISSGVTRPIKLVPHVLEAPSAQALADPCPSLNTLNLAPSELCFLTAFNLRSGLSRKNPLAAIKAFQLAFPERTTPVKLILKIQDSHLMPANKQKVEAMVGDDPRIVFFDANLDEMSMWQLINRCDCILSMHRAEGFGLLMLQGQMLEKYVVATGWSANMEFMTEPRSYTVPYTLVPIEDEEGFYPKNGRWADPDVHAAAAILKKIYNDHNKIEKK